MRNRDHENDQSIVVDLVKHSVVANANAVRIRHPGQFRGIMGPGILTQLLDRAIDAASVRLRKAVQFSLRRILDQQLIHYFDPDRRRAPAYGNTRSVGSASRRFISATSPQSCAVISDGESSRGFLRADPAVPFFLSLRYSARGITTNSRPASLSVATAIFLPLIASYQPADHFPKRFFFSSHSAFSRLFSVASDSPVRRASISRRVRCIAPKL